MICFKGPILLRASSLLVHVAEGEVALHHRFHVHFACHLGFLDFFHQRLEIAHPEEPGDKAVRIEAFEVLDGLSRPDKDDPALCLGNGREGAATFCSAVHLGDDHAVDPDRFVEPACLLACLLAECGIDHEPAVGGFRDRVEVDDLLDEIGFKRVASLGIDDDNFQIL